MSIRFLTAGESHGRCLTAIIEGLPAGLGIDIDAINADLARRQGGYGRGGRMKIEQDRVEILSGLRHGYTLASPLTLKLENKDWANWQEAMDPHASPSDSADARTGPEDETQLSSQDPITQPRPGHADLTGGLKYGHHDLRNVLERASARETAIRTAVGSVAKQLLNCFGVRLFSWVLGIGPAHCGDQQLASLLNLTLETADDLQGEATTSPVSCPYSGPGQEMVRAIDKAQAAGDTLGGYFQVTALGLPPGLGSHAHWDRRLEGRLAMALMSVNAVKAVEVGAGQYLGYWPGSRAHDPIVPSPKGPAGTSRSSNNAGGIEGGITTGMPLVLRATMKPIATLRQSLPSVDLRTGAVVAAHHERSDVCAVPAAAVIAEAVTAIELARAFTEKFGGDSISEMQRNLQGYTDNLGRQWEDN